MKPATSSTVEINGYALRWGRKLMNLTPAALAKTLVPERDRTYIVKIETGAVTQVSVETFNSLVTALHLEDGRALRSQPHKAAA